MTTDAIEAGWRGYLKYVIPSDAGPVQIEESRRAFYAGAHVLLACVLFALKAPEAELDNFVESLKGQP